MASEKEKMLSEQAYKASDTELFEERLHAQKTCFDFNNSSPELIAERHDLIRRILGSVSSEFYIQPPFQCDYGYNIHLGNHFYSNYNLTILDCAEVRIGDHVMIAPNVSIFTAGHPIDANKRNEEWEYAIPVTIGNNVWIGGNSVINPGVSIGNNTVIGSGSVVTRDIPSKVIAAGNPCKVIREITKADENFYFKDRRF